MVLVAQRLERGPVESKVGAYPKILSVSDRGSEGSQGRSEPRVGVGLMPGEFSDDGSMFIK